jgi:Glycosyltransferase family 87
VRTVPVTRVNPRGYVAWTALWVVWLASRTVIYLLATRPDLLGDIASYQHWYGCCFSRGTFPVNDPMWQYPPGAGLAFWLPGRLPGSYVDDFTLFAVGCDLAATVMLITRAKRGGSPAGAWYWVCAGPVLGVITDARFDVFPVALAVAALCLPARGSAGGRARGALIGAGAAVKAWPATLLAGTPPGQWRRALGAAAAVFAAACLAFPGAAASFLAHQSTRGVEIESVAATAFMIWRTAGWHGTWVYRFGAWQLSGPYVTVAQDAARVCFVLALVAVIAWSVLIARGRVRWRPEFAADAPLAATLLFLVTSPVLSPQYILWVLGLAAVCLATGQTTQRPVALGLLAVAGITQIVFPGAWPHLLSGSAPVTGVLVLRNALLVAAAALSWQRLLRAAPAAASPSHRGDQPDRAQSRSLTLRRRSMTGLKAVVSTARSAGGMWSMKCCRTLSTWDGATRSIVARPRGVSTAYVPRLSPSQATRRTRPRSSMRVIWWESLLRDCAVRSASSVIRSLFSGASDSSTRIS